MKKFYSLLFALHLVLHVFSQDCGCDYTITTDMSYFMGDAVAEGETICLESGIRGSLKIKNVNGTVDNPIQIINCGGEVVFKDPSSASALLLDGCSHFQLTGTGSLEEYGFFIQNPGSYGLVIRNLTNHFEIDHLHIQNAAGYAVYLRDNPKCDLTANEGYHTLEDVDFHHLLINDCGSGISIGHPFFGLGLYEPSCGVLYPYHAENIRISNSIIRDVLDGDAVALYGCDGILNNNVIEDISGKGFAINNECHLLFERNMVKRTDSYGFHIQGGGDHQFHSNVLVDNGNDSYGAVLIEMFGAVGDTYENTFLFEHNTIVNAGSYCLGVLNSSEVSSLSRVENNIFCEPSPIEDLGYEYSPYYFAESSPLILVNDNLLSDSRYDIGFVNADEDNFNLQHFSTAINEGVLSDLSSDFNYQPRNLAGAPDLGAYEYVPEARSYFGAIDLVGLYVDDFKNILGDESAEMALLEYAKENGFNYLLLYNLSYIHTHGVDLTDPEEAIILANFIERAKKEYGIAQMGAVGEKDASFDKIETFNALFSDSWYQKFDVLNLEFEFWTDPGSAVFSYYCENYLASGGYPCTNIGAFNFYSDQLELIDERAHEMGIISEIYLGYTTDVEMINLSERTDRILLHHYRTSDTYGDGSSIYNYHTNRIRAIAQSDRKPAVMPIFSSRSYHMGPWLLTHSLHQPMDTWLNGVEGYYEDETEGVNELHIAGFQWYRYTSFLDLIEGFFAPESMPSADQKGENAVQATYLSHSKVLTIEQKELPIATEGACELYNSTGTLIFSTGWFESTQKIDLSSLPVGIYFLCLTANQEIVLSQKISVF